MHYTRKTPCDMIGHWSFLVISVLSASTPYGQSASTSTATPSPAHLNEEDTTPTQAHRALATHAYDTCEFKIVSPKFITYSLPFKDIYYSVFIYWSSYFSRYKFWYVVYIHNFKKLMWKIWYAIMVVNAVWIEVWILPKAPTASRISSWPQCITIFNNTPATANQR